MNKSIRYIIILILAVTWLACYKDKGNYNYSDKEVIGIKGIQAEYTRVSFDERLTIRPDVSSSLPGADFEYNWGLYKVDITGATSPKMDTIGRTHDLDYPVNLAAGDWMVVFSGKNKKTGVSAFKTFKLTVTTRFTRGWYVIKDDGTNTDLDLFLTPATIEPGSKVENVFSLVNGRKLAGKAGSLNFYSTYKSYITGTNANTRAFMVWSDNDAAAIDVNTLHAIRDFNNLFYEPPATKKVSSIHFGIGGIYMINNGLLHSIYTTGTNTGIFGGPQIADDIASPYRLTKYHVTSVLHNPCMFDEISSTFFLATGNGSILIKATNNANSKMPAANNNKTLLYMGARNASSTMAGYAIMRDKTDPNLRLLTSVSVPGSNSAITLSNDTLLSSSNLYHGEKFTLNFADETLLYFSRGNQIWSRNLSNKAEVLQFTVPAGEEVAFIRHRKYTGTATAEMPFYHNYIIIGTQVGNKYKIRMFTKASGNLATIPAVVLEGEGHATDLMYLSPSVSEATYPNTY